MKSGRLRARSVRGLSPNDSHQIREHAAHLGHPVVGDRLHGDAYLPCRAGQLLLHAVEFAFAHPVTGKVMRIVIEPPPDIVYAQRLT